MEQSKELASVSTASHLVYHWLISMRYFSLKIDSFQASCSILTIEALPCVRCLIFKSENEPAGKETSGNKLMIASTTKESNVMQYFLACKIFYVSITGL